MDELLKRWREVYDSRQAATAAIRAQIDELTEVLADIESPFTTLLRELETDIIRGALEGGQCYAAGGVKVSYRKGYERANWDGKRLDGYAAAHPEILAFRSVSQVAPSVNVSRLA